MTHSAKPNLIIMMHRLGDLIMTLPLMHAMQTLYPNNPLWVVAEPAFYAPLSKLVPHVQFFSPNDEIIVKTQYEKVLNISQRKEAYTLSSKIQYTDFIGQITKNNYLVVEGFWQIYRTSLTQSSRHNLFHWADLHALDTLNQNERESINYILPKKAKGRKIGLFLGASSSLKRPEPKFYAELANSLAKRGYIPYFLGGKCEIELGKEVSKLYGSSENNLVNAFSLEELASFMQELDLLITPDTGPMHLAAALGLQTLALSLGNVNPYETSVVQPKHYVLQANISCSSCWDCYRNYECKQAFVPYKVAAIASSILEDRAFPKINGLSLYKTKRELGLSTLESIIANGQRTRKQLDEFWKAYFLALSINSKSHYPISNLSDKIAIKLHKEKAKLLNAILLSFKTNIILSENFWQTYPPIIRIFASFVQTYLENASYSKKAYLEVFDFIERI